MASLSRLFLVFLTTVFLASCHFTEEVRLEEDGSGSISLSFDGSQLLSLTDSAEAANKVRKDSVILFSEVLDAKRDSIRRLPADEQARLEALRPYSLRMIEDHQAGELRFILSREFEDIAGLGDVLNAFQDASILEPGEENLSMNSSGEAYPSTEVAYSFSGNRFTRRGYVVDSALQRQRLDSLKSSEAFLEESTYKLQLHFPRRIKSASLEGATLSMDGKTLYYEVGFLDYIKNPEKLNLEVLLED